MAFEESPQFEGFEIKSRTSVMDWIGRHGRLLFLLVFIFALVGITFGIYIFSPKPAPPPGGLDGCIIASDGTPVSATVSLGTVSRQTHEDGCFFFAAMNPGKYRLKILTSYGQVSEQPVEIISGQAVELGEIRLTP